MVGGPFGRPGDHGREGGARGMEGRGPKAGDDDDVVDGVFRTALPHRNHTTTAQPLQGRQHLPDFVSFFILSLFVHFRHRAEAILPQNPKSKSRFIKPPPSPLVLHLPRHAQARTG